MRGEAFTDNCLRYYIVLLSFLDKLGTVSWYLKCATSEVNGAFFRKNDADWRTSPSRSDFSIEATVEKADFIFGGKIVS